jgi:hypothetical protein
MKLAASLHRVDSDLVNIYLVAESGGVTVVDAGLPGHWEELEATRGDSRLREVDGNTIEPLDLPRGSA